LRRPCLRATRLRAATLRWGVEQLPLLPPAARGARRHVRRHCLRQLRRHHVLRLLQHAGAHALRGLSTLCTPHGPATLCGVAPLRPRLHASVPEDHTCLLPTAIPLLPLQGLAHPTIWDVLAARAPR